MKIFPTPPYEGNDCQECGADVDIETKLLRRPEGLATIEIGTHGWQVRLCPYHIKELAVQTLQWQGDSV